MTHPTLDDALRTKQVEYLRLSLDQVEIINRKRAQYILVYGAWFLIQVYILFTLNSQGQWTQFLVALTGLASAALLFFYWRFVSVLRMMGFVYYLWLPICLIAAMPIPGILVVAYIDRMISKSLVKGYKQRDEDLARLHHEGSPDLGERGQ